MWWDEDRIIEAYKLYIKDESVDYHTAFNAIQSKYSINEIEMAAKEFYLV